MDIFSIIFSEPAPLEIRTVLHLQDPARASRGHNF